MNEWMLFALGCLTLCTILFVPGYCIARVFQLPSRESVLIAPIVGVFLVLLVSTVNVVVGVRSSCITVMLPVVILCILSYAIAFFALKKNRTGQVRIERKDRALIALYVLIGVMLGYWLFLRPIQSPEMFAQVWDNASHVNLVQSFLESGQYRIIGSSPYVVNGEMIPDSGFYPTAFYSLAALVASLVGLSSPVAINVVNFVFIAAVYPLGCLLLLSKLFDDDYVVLLAGAFACLGFVAFPWRFLHWGTIFPNMIAFCMMPAALWLFVNLFSGKNRLGTLPNNCVLAGMTLCTLVISQPNAVFTLGVLILPFILVQLYSLGKSQGGEHDKLRGLLYAGAFFLLVAVLWLALRKVPFLSVVVNTAWESVSTPPQALLDIVTMKLTGTWDPFAAPQLLMALLCVIGCIVLVRKRIAPWLIVSFVFVVIIYFVDASTDGRLKLWLAGYWYADPSRTAAMVALAAVPLCAYGMGWILKKVSQRFGVRSQMRPVALGALLAAFMVLNYLPTVVLDSATSIPTAFGGNEAMIIEEYRQDKPNILDADEMAFLKEVRTSVPEGAFVLNQVCDGSVYAYGAAGVPTVYRTFFEIAENAEEDPTAYTMQHYLNQIATRPDVQAAVKQVGATYFLQLDAVGGNAKTIMYSSPIFPVGATEGMDAVTPETPGFTVVLARDDMALYKITALD